MPLMLDEVLPWLIFAVMNLAVVWYMKFSCDCALSMWFEKTTTTKSAF